MIAGATGLVGSKLLTLEIGNISTGKIYVLARNPIEMEHPKVSVLITDFKDFRKYEQQFRETNDLYCCIGTTIKKAKSKEAFREVDFGIPLKLAEFANICGIQRYIAISSLGANPRSGNFYLKTKGEMEREVSKYHFKKLAFLRPSLLIGHRNEFRFGEKIAQFFTLLISPVLVGRFKKYRPIMDVTVAKAMMSISRSINNQRVYQSNELHWLGM